MFSTLRRVERKSDSTTLDQGIHEDDSLVDAMQTEMMKREITVCKPMA